MAKALSKTEEKTWAMAAHMSALFGLIFPPGLVLGPLLVWLFKRNESTVVDKNGKEAINFQGTILVGTFILAILSAASTIFLLLTLIVGIAGLGLAVYGGIQAKKTGSYTYPFAIRLIK
ncbi:DUF4870 domain-containing protein [Leucothrix arctica]|uniref:DUF4870 domain-containing protein n=1 Tax=Leucothrix arctica TaxID=1481894 RepID=A0A317CKE9_9GAMM|nr:DUF4870 domain-containing protein [Leucothrix arctica]PWQ98809.1 DUF4870 domain-containing protein [Leucothrix arctica]